MGPPLRLPVTEAAVVRPAGHALVHAIRWGDEATPAGSHQPKPMPKPDQMTVIAA